MRKLLMLGLIFFASTALLHSQNMLKGKVVDRQGNPISGAKVENANGKEQTTTDMKGNFTLETTLPVKKVDVHYMGLNTAHKKAKQDIVVKMSQTTWWNKRPNKYKWLVGLDMVVPDNEGFNPAFGFMIGRVKTIGWYVKGVYHKAETNDDDFVFRDGDYVYANEWFTGEKKSGYWSAVAGVLVRLGCPFHFYAGVGYVDRQVAWEGASGKFYEYEEDSYDGLAVDAGIMLDIERVFLNAGFQTCPNKYEGLAFNVGIGVSF